MTILRIIISLFLALLVLGSSFPAHAALEEFVIRLNVCKSFNTVVARARCYDEAISDYDLGTMELAPIKNANGKWRVSIEKSEIDESDNVFANLNGSGYVVTRSSEYFHPSIVVLCKEGVPQGYVVWNISLGENEAPIKIRWGKDEEKTESWKLSSDTQATFIPDISQFIKNLKNYESLFIEVTPATRDLQSSIFDLRGSASALETLTSTCKLQ